MMLLRLPATLESRPLQVEVVHDEGKLQQMRTARDEEGHRRRT
jgi:hypothetical protein